MSDCRGHSWRFGALAIYYSTRKEQYRKQENMVYRRYETYEVRHALAQGATRIVAFGSYCNITALTYYLGFLLTGEMPWRSKRKDKLRTLMGCARKGVMATIERMCKARGKADEGWSQSWQTGCAGPHFAIVIRIGMAQIKTRELEEAEFLATKNQ